MKANSHVKILIFLILGFGAKQLPAISTSDKNHYVEVVDQLLNMEIDNSKSFVVNNYSFSKDIAAFTLKKGIIHFLKPVDGRVIGAIFNGDGLLELKPPTSVEQDQLFRHTEKRDVKSEFNFLLLLFADGTDTDFEQALQLINSKPGFQTETELSRAIKKISDDDKKYFKTPVIRFLLDRVQNNYFFAYVKNSAFMNSDEYHFEINPYQNEEISFKRENDLICKFHKQSDYKFSKTPRYKDKDPLKITKSTLKCSLDYDLELFAEATIDIVPKTNSDWLYVHLYSKLEVDSAHWEDGEKAEIFKGEENSQVWIKGQQSFAKNKMQRLKIFYHGEIITKAQIKLGGSYQEFIALRSSLGWYPWYRSTNQRTIFDISFITPRRFNFVSVGSKQSYEVIGEEIHSNWKTKLPIRNASFNIGRFTDYEIKDDRVVPITIMMSEDWHKGMWLNQGSEMEKQVGEDVTKSMVFYEHMLGETEVEHFYVTEIPQGHGEAFPGLIHLAWSTFQHTDEEGYDKIFRAHEVAHQWWGISVDFQSYHDQWISEGLAEFSSLWYFQTVSENKQLYFDILEKYKEGIIENRKYLFGDGIESGPIWLGRRTSTTETRGDYGLIVYNKTAWVWHMLRSMMINLQNMNEDPFNAMMRDIFQTYRGKKPSTADIQKIVEKHTGMSMNWFFQQWIYGTDIPEYKFAYKMVELEGGKYQVTCKIKTENVSDDFQMYVPIKIDIDGDRYARLRVHVTGKNATVKLPIIPFEPENIIFNDLSGVLADVEVVDWDEI